MLLGAFPEMDVADDASRDDGERNQLRGGETKGEAALRIVS